MISKFCAAALVALVLSPFTAPFSTYDFPSPFRHTGTGVPFRSQVTAAAMDPNAALMPARVIPRGHKIVARLGRSDRKGSPLSPHVVSFADSVLSAQRREALHTILRL